MYIPNASLKLSSLPRALEMYTWFLKYVMVRHRTGGGICNPGTFTEFHIHIQNTSPDRDVMLSGICVF